MRSPRRNTFKLLAMSGCAVVALATVAQAQEKSRFEIAGGDLKAALQSFAGQTNQEVLFSSNVVEGRRTAGVSAELDAQTALAQLLQGTGLTYRQTPTGTLLIVQPEGGSSPQAASAGDVDALIVTAQKREENIQDVPIAISAFSQEELTNKQVAGGPDLMTQVPNMTFTKTNFSGYSIQIRGIGTQAISATTDPAVAVAFNNTPFVRNRFFEQEFYDLERVEVLRGPQGTLYGRNATAGVVNLISSKPKFHYESMASGDLGNYASKRLEGMVNIPLVEDKLALRVAGAWTQRNGYVTNEISGNPIDGRDLWSSRVSLRFEPTDAISANLIWEHFEEDDDRLRSGKQLCHRDFRPEIGGVPMPDEMDPGQNSSANYSYSQGCKAASLYGKESFQTPNGFSLPYYQALSQVGLPTVQGLDPYLSTVQSPDLRVIESTIDPEYRASTDTFELQARFDIGDNLTLDSETAYSSDTLYSTQDYNRFNTAPGAFDYDRFYTPGRLANARPNLLTPDGVFCDPQLGCSDRLVAMDLSTAESRHFSQEFRLSSDYDGPFNFSLGANFLRYDTEDKYYVFINTITMYAAKAQDLGNPHFADGPYVPGVSDNTECLDYLYGDPNVVNDFRGCIYIDPNPISSLNDLGHNYFLSKNPYRLISYAAFGEVYYNLLDNLKLTAGLRWTVDKKHAPQIPSWLLADSSIGYPVREIVDAEWSEPTGRLTIDWKPELSFTDETLFYASYARGYKAGGTNPPPMVVVAGNVDVAGVVESVLHPPTFDAEFVNAYEIGTKNTLFDGKVTFNANAFYYDYKGYQISQIIDRSALNSNFDAEVWGVEFEADWRPFENLRLGLKGGYEKTRMADGSQAIDVMDRTDGREGWVVSKPFPSLPSNCILPLSLVTYGGRINSQASTTLAGDNGFCVQAYLMGIDPVTKKPYEANPSLTHLDPSLQIAWAGWQGFNPASAPNNGEGFFKDLSGNELPNAPHFTGTLSADYFAPMPNEWLLNLHADFYYQSEAWTRVFNTEGYDKLKAYNTLNMAAILTNPDAGWKVMAYVKNVFNRDSITGAFLNSDDSGLTTNVFLTEPRLFGLRVTKEWGTIPLLGEPFGERREHAIGEPYPFTFEFGGGPVTLQPDTDVHTPDFLSIYLPDNYPLAVQSRELDTGDAREARLTYAPGGRDGWRFSGGVRYGKANGNGFGQDTKVAPDVCFTFYTYTCQAGPENWGSSTVHDREDYTLADFQVGREVGLGVWSEGGSSVVSAGLRYAELGSQSGVEHRTDPDQQVPTGTDAISYTVNWHDYLVDVAADRSFKGVGPMISWEGSGKLLGGRETGHIDLDWGVSGGVLFGDQKRTVRQRTRETKIVGPYFGAKTETTTIATEVFEETKSINVPTVGASVGLSYSIDWMKLGAGYRWERYFDAIDGGFEERKAYDRTIDGPYFKVSVGFGG